MVAGLGWEQSLARVQMRGLICYWRHAFHESAQLPVSLSSMSHTFRWYLQTLYRLESTIILPSGVVRRGVSLDMVTIIELDWRALCAAVMLKRRSGKVMNSCGTQIWPGPQPQLALGLRRTGQMARDWTHTHTHIHLLLLFLFSFFHTDPQHKLHMKTSSDAPKQIFNRNTKTGSVFKLW